MTYGSLTENEIVTIIAVVIGLVAILYFSILISRKNKTVQDKPPLDDVRKRSPSQKHLSESISEVKTQTSLQGQEVSAVDIPWSVRLKKGLFRTRQGFVHGLQEFFLSKQNKNTREETLERLFELLIESDVGYDTSEKLVQKVKARITAEQIHDFAVFQNILKEEILSLLNFGFENPKGIIEHTQHKPFVVLLVGVNGVGKTTTTGKLAYKTSAAGKKVIVGAADTFRAAAVEQLAVWSQRAQATLIQLKEKSDPASVAFESVKQARLEGFDFCFIDTAGRLQNRNDLMQELSKVSRVIAKDLPEAPHEVLLVLDATTGQNAIQQAMIFREAVNVTGIILTKLDGTAKGGVVIAIAEKLKLPIRYIGVGESVEDLHVFKPEEFVEALFS